MRAWIERRTGADGRLSERIRYEAPDRDGVVGIKSETVRQLPDEDPRDLHRRAKDRLAELQTDVRRGAYVPDDVLTVKDVVDEWLAIRSPDLAASTRVRHGYARRIVVEGLGAVRVQALTARQIQSFYRRLVEGGAKPGGVKNVHKVLAASLRQAVAWGVVAKSPMIGVRAPRSEDRPPTIWTPAQMALALRAADADERDGPLWRLAMATGMRIGELLALRWSDVDLDGGTIAVRRSLTIEETGRVVVGQTTKVKRARRSVSLPPAAVAALRSHRTRQNERRLKLGADWADPDERRVFDRGDGGILRPGTCRVRFARFCAAAGLPAIRIHDQRHSNATEDLGAGTNPKVVADRLGISVKTLLGTYGHALPSAHTEAAAAFEARMRRAQERAERDDTTDVGGDSAGFAPNPAPNPGHGSEKSA